VDLPRRAGRRTNVALLVLLTVAVGTGVAGFAVGTTSTSRVVAIAHGAAGIAVLLLAPWKSVIARRGLRAARSQHRRTGSLVLAALVLVSIGAGVLHAVAGYQSLGGVTAMQLHVGAGLLAIPFAFHHVASRPQRPRRADLSRRNALRALALGGGAALSYAAVEGTAAAFRLPGADRRATGSHEVGSGHPPGMPVTQSFTDDVPAVEVDSWRLTVTTSAGSTDHTYADLAGGADAVTAVLDCTGGWYAEQRWSGVRLDRLLPASVLAGSGSVDVVSVTGYRRRFPLTDAHRLLLATSAGGRPLSAGHGAPVRLVAPARRGFWWVKWVDRVEVVDGPWWWQPPFPLQ